MKFNVDGNWILEVTVDKKDIMSPCFQNYRDFQGDIMKRKNYVCLTMGLND
jgi:hypothetical protein